MGVEATTEGEDTVTGQPRLGVGAAAAAGAYGYYNNGYY